jgi:hypothetical protein
LSLLNELTRAEKSDSAPDRKPASTLLVGGGAAAGRAVVGDELAAAVVDVGAVVVVVARVVVVEVDLVRASSVSAISASDNVAGTPDATSAA